MELQVDEEYYVNVCDFYAEKIADVELKLNVFKKNCDSLFEVNNYGEELQTILSNKYMSFYTNISSVLNELLENVKSWTGEFLTDVETDDKLS